MDPRVERYGQLRRRLEHLFEGESDEIALLATAAGELFHADDRFDWAGFYRVVRPGWLKLGPYQGDHGCLSIPFARGVCGRCARERRTQRVPDVTRDPDHLACSRSTRSEIVVPLLDSDGRLRAVLDIDSDTPAAFDELDGRELEAICALIGRGVGWPGRAG